MGRRRVIFLAVAALALGGLAAFRQPLWRSLYPYLPPRIQAVPYRVRGWLAPAATPRPLPTPRPAEAGPPPTTVALAASPSPPAAADRLATASPRSAPMPAAPPSPPATSPRPAAAEPLPAQAALVGVRHSYQTWNNCGPATISMALSVLGLDEGQAKAAVRLKPNPDDKNVGLGELARYARERGAAAEVRVGGSIAVLRGLVALGVPVIVETWFVPEPGDEMGHYRLVTGYDADAGTIALADSYEGPALTLGDAALDADWRVFNRGYLAVYLPAQAAAVGQRIGDGGTAMWLSAAAQATDEIGRAPDAFAWFNLGESLQAVGDSAGAADAFDRARAIGLPWRMLWYQFGPFAAYGAVGRWDDVAALAEANLANAPDLEESWTWLGHARAARGDAAGAEAAWRRAVALNPLDAAAQAALATAESR